MNALRQFDRHGRDAAGAPVGILPSEAVWQRAPRYSDQPMSWRSRLFGMGGVSTIALLVLGGALITWRGYTVSPASPKLSVFDVAPPAAPPEPPSEIPPGPEQVEREKPLLQPEMPKIEPLLIQIPGLSPIAPPLPEKSDPGPPIERTTAPEAKSAPPAPRQSNAKPTWEGMVLAALNKTKRYPRLAASRREQGVPYIRFVMDRGGKVLSSRLERSSGFAALDDEAVGLPRRASPLPKPPEDVPGDTIELVVPVEFFMGSR